MITLKSQCNGITICKVQIYYLQFSDLKLLKQIEIIFIKYKIIMLNIKIVTLKWLEYESPTCCLEFPLQDTSCQGGRFNPLKINSLGASSIGPQNKRNKI